MALRDLYVCIGKTPISSARDLIARKSEQEIVDEIIDCSRRVAAAASSSAQLDEDDNDDDDNGPRILGKGRGGGRGGGGGGDPDSGTDEDGDNADLTSFAPIASSQVAETPLSPSDLIVEKMHIHYGTQQQQ